MVSDRTDMLEAPETSAEAGPGKPGAWSWLLDSSWQSVVTALATLTSLLAGATYVYSREVLSSYLSAFGVTPEDVGSSEIIMVTRCAAVGLMIGTFLAALVWLCRATISSVDGVAESYTRTQILGAVALSVVVLVIGVVVSPEAVTAFGDLGWTVPVWIREPITVAFALVLVVVMIAAPAMLCASLNTFMRKAKVVPLSLSVLALIGVGLARQAAETAGDLGRAAFAGGGESNDVLDRDPLPALVALIVIRPTMVPVQLSVVGDDVIEVCSQPGPAWLLGSSDGRMIVLTEGDEPHRVYRLPYERYLPVTSYAMTQSGEQNRTASLCLPQTPASD